TILATGARSRELPNLPQDGKKIIGYRQAMNLPTQPKSMVVVGSGAIGVEFAYFYNAIGTKVTIVEFMDRIVPVEDEEVSKQLEKSLKKAGIDILTKSEVLSVDTKSDLSKAKIKTAKGEEIIEAEVVLSALGITPSGEKLGHEQRGVSPEKGRVVVDQFYRTNVSGVYAIGDRLPGPALAHRAAAGGITCVEKINGRRVDPITYNNS